MTMAEARDLTGEEADAFDWVLSEAAKARKK